MVDILFQIGVAKLVVSVLLAGVAWAVQRRVGHPGVAHRLWLVVLVALLLPAVVAIPVLPGGGGVDAVIPEAGTLAGEASAQVPPVATGDERGEVSLPFNFPVADNGKAVLVVLWLAVAALLLAWTLVRALRFRHWLARTSLPAPRALRDEVAGIGQRLGLVRVPEVLTTTARVSPMVCWTGGRVRLVIPAFLTASLDGPALRAVIAHELAHVRRCDHLVRWIEWMACTAFWWNPVTWWAGRELRAAEEASCDALGAAAIRSSPRAYARSLVKVLEVMSTPPTPSTPAFSSSVTSGRSSASLERRLRMLVRGPSNDRAPRWIRRACVAAALCLLPFGLVYGGTGDQEMSTPLVESPRPPETTLVVLPGPERPDTTELERLWGSENPVYAYWVFASNSHDGPYALADAPVQPLECRLEPEASDEDARDEAMAECARALSRDLEETDAPDDRNVCVVWGNRASGWRGICEGWQSEERHRLHGNDKGSVLLEPIAVAGSER
ncbi:MAG: M56 family metallopeptidase [Gemmatimonadetes bacterium]|nr:M56 family metallopeptidase [Gemmatimonadota bacterium]